MNASAAPTGPAARPTCEVGGRSWMVRGAAHISGRGVTQRQWLPAIEEQSSLFCLGSSFRSKHSLKQSHSDSQSLRGSVEANLSIDCSLRWNSSLSRSYFLLNPPFNLISSLLSLSLFFSRESLNLLDLRSEYSTASHKQPSHSPAASLKARATWWLPPLGETTSGTGSERAMGTLHELNFSGSIFFILTQAVFRAMSQKLGVSFTHPL